MGQTPPMIAICTLWYGPDITAYASGTRQRGGDFDIANVTLLAPETGNHIACQSLSLGSGEDCQGTLIVGFCSTRAGDDWWHTDDLGT